MMLLGTKSDKCLCVKPFFYFDQINVNKKKENIKKGVTWQVLDN